MTPKSINPISIKNRRYFIFLILSIFIFKASCLGAEPFTSFSIEIVNGNCLSNGIITLKFPAPTSGSYENGWTAELSSPNIQPQLISIPTNGNSISFTNLSSGNYSLKITNGITTIQYANNPVNVTSTYVTMQTTDTSTAPTCPPTTINATNDAKITINVTGGNGPFEYIVNSPTLGSQNYTTSQRNHTFMGMKAGETVSYTIVDQGCSSSISSTYKIIENTEPGLSFSQTPFNFIRIDNGNNSCDDNLLYVNLTASSASYQNRLDLIKTPGNATITFNGNTYNLKYLGIVYGNYENNHRFVYDPAQNNGVKILHNTAFNVSFNWGCATLTKAGTFIIDDTYLSFGGAAKQNTNCTYDYTVNVSGSYNYYIFWKANNTLLLEKEDLTSPTGYTVIQSSTLPISNYSTELWPSNSKTFSVSGPGNYRVTVSDACHTITKTATVPLPPKATVEKLLLYPTASILEGTSGFNVEFNSTSGLLYPVQMKIERFDGQKNININASQPLNLANSYNITFPFEYIFNSVPTNVTDLPIGRYLVTFKDKCNTEKTYDINLLGGPTYNSQITKSLGCINSNSITYNLNKNNFSFNPATVEIRYRNIDGTSGNLITSSNFNKDGGQFNNLPSGQLRLIYRNAGGSGISVARNTTLPTSYFHDFDIENYQNIDISISTEFCDPGSQNSGIASAEVSSGTLVYPLTMAIYSTNNPATPLQGPISLNSPQKGTVFTGLQAGEYFIRTTSSCYSFDKSFTINKTNALPQAKVSEGFVCPGSPSTFAVISATNNLYDITWVVKNNGNETIVGSGMPVTFAPTQTTTYTAKYQLKSTFNCPNTTVYESDVTVNVTSNPNLNTPKVTDIELCKNANPTVIISNTENNFIYEVVNASNQSFNPKITGVGNGSSITLNVPLPLNVGQLNVTSTNGNAGCKGILADAIQITKSTPLTSLEVIGSYTCSGSNGTITIKHSENGITYTILKNGVQLSPSITLSGTGNDITVTIPAAILTSTSNEFTIKASGSGCEDGILINKGIITVQQTPTASNITHAFCNSTKGILSLNTTGGSGSYEYSMDNTNWTTNSTFTNLNIGTYTIYVRDINNNCTTQNTFQILENCFEFTKTSTTNPNHFSKPGDILTYQLTVKNTGTSTLNNIQISDPQSGISNTIIGPISPGNSANVTAQYIVTQQDINNGSFTNTATATLGSFSTSSSVTINSIQTPSIKLTKSTTSAYYNTVGQVINYTFTVENIGNVTLDNISISDLLPGLSAITPSTVISLSPGSITTFNAAYTITQNDINNGTLENTATVNGYFKNVKYTNSSSVKINSNILLPASRLELKAKWINNNTDAELLWMTLTEQNTDYFIVEKSIDGINFQSIQNKIIAAGYSNIQKNYFFMDKHATELEKIFYRIKLVDRDQSVNYSNTVLLKKSTKEIKLFPNPVVVKLTIQLDESSQYCIQLLGNNGQLIQQYNNIDGALNKMYTINRNGLPEGTYIIRVTNLKTYEISHYKVLFIN